MVGFPTVLVAGLWSSRTSDSSSSFSVTILASSFAAPGAPAGVSAESGQDSHVPGSLGGILDRIGDAGFSCLRVQRDQDAKQAVR